MNKNELQLWQSVKSGDANARAVLATRHYGLVHHMVNKVASKRTAQHEELLSAASIGFMQAIDSFDVDRGLLFSTHAAPRIHGAMLDHLRQCDVLGRKTRRKVTDMRRAQQTVSQKTGQEPSLRELATELGTTERDIRNRQLSVLFETQVDISEAYTAESHDQAFIDLEMRDEVAHLIKSANLTERERELIQLSFFENRSNVEICKQWGLTESRVSQIYKQVMTKLRTVAV